MRSDCFLYRASYARGVLFALQLFAPVSLPKRAHGFFDAHRHASIMARSRAAASAAFLALPRALDGVGSRACKGAVYQHLRQASLPDAPPKRRTPGIGA